MKVTTLRIRNLKGYADTGVIELSPTINLLVGSNNAGKSTIIKALKMLQPENSNDPTEYLYKNRRKKVDSLALEIGFDSFYPKYFPNLTINGQLELWKNKIEIISIGTRSSRIFITKKDNSQQVPVDLIIGREPNNFIYPYFSKRKPVSFNEQIRAENALIVKESFYDLYTKVDRIANPNHPNYKEYEKACNEILGFSVSCALSTNGKQAAIIVDSIDHIPIDEMGEGIVNILGLIVDLCVAEDKLFLIEELENDIHPKALKAMLDLIIQKSETNQFVISTHSNIVVKYLGAAADAKLFNVKMELKERMPHSLIKAVPNTPEDRIKILEDLGYDLYDFELWKAYLILEESSAERIIRECLIPTFTPTLENKLRTIAAQGVSDLEPRFHDFLRLFVFVHLSEAYKGKAWVYADGDDAGKKAIKELKEKFEKWPEEHFLNFSKPNFEDYYPARWKEKADAALAIEDKKKRYKAKGDLVNEVMNWVKEDKGNAENEFKESAAEIIEHLKILETKLSK